MSGTALQRTPWQIQKAVIFALFIRELKTRFGNYKGGFIWMLIEPLAHVTIMSLIFTYVRHRQLLGIDIPVFIVTGIVPFLLFKNIALRVMDGVDANRGLFSFRQIKPMDAFIARALLDGILSISVFAILLVAMSWLGMDVPFKDPLTVILIFAVMVPAGMGLGMIFCVTTHYMPEAKTLIRLLFMPLYLFSGVIFPVASLPQKYIDLLLWNPLLHAVETLRGAFFDHYHVVQGVSPGYFLMATLAVLALGMAWYFTKRHDLLAR